jgi:hypothetical protein
MTIKKILFQIYWLLKHIIMDLEKFNIKVIDGKGQILFY